MPSIKYKKKTYAGATFPVLEMTKAEYDALPEAKKMDGTVYMITDDTGGWEAENASYDNTESGLTATNVQDALDEIVGSTVHSVMETYQRVSVPQGTSHVENVTINAPSGYKILCITRAITNGWNAIVNMPGISQTSTKKIFDLWLSPAPSSANCTIDVQYLLYK